MKIFKKICNILSYICCGISAASCVIMMILVTIDTTLRYTVSSPLRGTFEVCQCLLCLILFGGYAYCQNQHGFLHVTMLIRKFPRRLRCIIWALVSLFSVIVGGVLTYECFQRALTDLPSHASTTLLRIPMFPFEVFASIAFGILVLNLIYETVLAILAIFNDNFAEEIVF